MNHTHGNGGKSEEDKKFQLYKLEYELAANRYENIYQATWRIFSYLTVVAGGILTFGSNNFNPYLLGCLASVPLLFWFWSTFLPLDTYGGWTNKRLRKIEKTLNENYSTELDHFTAFHKNREGKKFRTRYIVRGAFIVLHFFFIYWGFEVIQKYRQGEPLLNRNQVQAKMLTLGLQDKSGELKVTTINLHELKQLLEKTSVEKDSSLSLENTPKTINKP